MMQSTFFTQLAESTQRMLDAELKPPVGYDLSSHPMKMIRVLVLPLSDLYEQRKRSGTYHSVSIQLPDTCREWLYDNPCWWVYVMFAEKGKDVSKNPTTEHWGFVSSQKLLHDWVVLNQWVLEQSWCLPRKRMVAIKQNQAFKQGLYDPLFYKFQMEIDSADDENVTAELVQEAIDSRLCLYAWVHSNIPLADNAEHDRFLYPKARSVEAKADAWAYWYILKRVLESANSEKLVKMWLQWENTIMEWRLNHILSTYLTAYSNAFEWNHFDSHLRNMEFPYCYPIEPGSDDGYGVEEYMKSKDGTYIEGKWLYHHTLWKYKKVNEENMYKPAAGITILPFTFSDPVGHIEQLAALGEKCTRIGVISSIESRHFCKHCRECPQPSRRDDRELERQLIPPCIQKAIHIDKPGEEEKENSEAVDPVWYRIWFYQSMNCPAEWFAYEYWRDVVQVVGEQHGTWRYALSRYRQQLRNPQQYPLTCKSMQKKNLCPYAEKDKPTRTCKRKMINTAKPTLTNDVDIEDIGKSISNIFRKDSQYSPVSICSSLTRVVDSVNRKRKAVVKTIK